MLKPDLIQIGKIMNNAVMDRVDEGEIATDEDGEIDILEFFGFSPEVVEGIHIHKIGIGDGVWYRLKDGRVFDNYGEETDPDPRLYDTTKN